MRIDNGKIWFNSTADSCINEALPTPDGLVLNVKNGIGEVVERGINVLSLFGIMPNGINVIINFV